jgi:cAMP-dependent protein kinase regulator
MPRSASVVAKTDGHLWALHRAAFRQVLVEAQDHRKELKRVLGEIAYFQFLDSDAINKLATIMDEVTFGRGENITEQGRPGDSMYVIASGTCYGVQMHGNETKRSNFKAGSYFGDEIFSSEHGKYSTTVVSLQTTVCWQLDHEVMKQTMGPLLNQG